MGVSLEQLAAAVLAAVKAGRVSEGLAQQLMGQLAFDAVGVRLSSSDHQAWRDELLALGIPNELLEAAQREMRTLDVRVEEQHFDVELTDVDDEREDIELLVHRLQVLGDPAAWEPLVEYDSLAVAIIDSVWSLGVRYQGVLNVIERYRALRTADGHDADHDSPEDLVNVISSVGGPAAFAERVNNRQRTSTRSGILKAEAVLLEAQMATSEGIATPGDLASADETRLVQLGIKWKLVPGQGSGLSWDYFLMLARLPGVKADRMVRRFVAAAGRPGEQAVSAREASTLVIEAAARLDVKSRDLDYAIWRYQSGQ